MLDWFKGILPENINIDHFSIIRIGDINSNNTKNSNNKIDSNIPYYIDGDKLIIDDTLKEGRQLANKLISEASANIQHNDAVLEDSNVDSLEAIDIDILSSNYDQLLAKYKPLVPKEDVAILEVAILIAIKYKKKENISAMKSQVVQRYGPRAGMICNLYSSGYFDTLIKPLYDSVTEGELALDEYLSVYHMIVTESPLAMFVGVGTTKAKAKVLLTQKIKSNKENEVGYLNIHGIGDANINMINSLLSDDDIRGDFLEDPTIRLTGKSIKATVYI